MSKLQNTETKSLRDGVHWYAVRTFGEDPFRVGAQAQRQGIEGWIPSQKVWTRQNGQSIPRREALLPQILFVRCGERQLRDFVMSYFWRIMPFLAPDGSPWIVDEKEIENLRLALSAGNGLIYMNLGAEGKPSQRPVRVVDGPYAGVHGYYKRVDGNRMVLLPVSGVATVRLPFIPPAALANA